MGFPFDKVFYSPIYTMDCLQGQGNHFFFYMESLQKNFTNICSSKKVLPGKVIADKRNINLLKGEVF